MKLFTAALLVLTMLGVASAPAAASIISPSPGASVSATGDLHYAGGPIDTICDVTLDGRIASSVSVNVSAASFTCGVGRMTVESLPATATLLVVGGQLTNEWSLPLTIRYDLPVYGTCRYQAALAGWWWMSLDAHLEIDPSVGLASVALLTGSSPLCPATPVLVGAFDLLGVVAA